MLLFPSLHLLIYSEIKTYQMVNNKSAHKSLHVSCTMKHIRSDMNEWDFYKTKRPAMITTFKCHYAESVASVEVKVEMDKSQAA